MVTLGKYELHEVIGKGGFGTVYRATDTALDRVVALKVLHPQLTVEPEFIERFRREARLMAKAEHPNIVSIYDVGEAQGRYFIAMRHLAGGSLADRLKKGPLSIEEAQRILQEVCAGLQELHRQGYVHRDLKPANILFDAAGRAVVTDFGLARAMQLSSSSSSGTTGGTPYYRAPELWNGRPPANPATDVYSLGCILGEMLTGKPLFGGDTPEEVLTRHLVHGPDFGEDWPPEGIPHRVRTIIEKALQRDPAQRYGDAQTFSQALAGLNPIIDGGKATGENAQTQAQMNLQIESEVRDRGETNEQSHQLAESVVSTPVTRKSLPRWTWALLGPALLLGLIYFAVRGLIPPGAPTALPTQPVVALVTESPTDTTIGISTSTPEPLSQTYTVIPASIPTLDPGIPPACTEAGQTWNSPVDGMTLVCVPAGEFEMGVSDETINLMLAQYSLLESGDFDGEQPVHTVMLDAYWIDQTEVTNRQFAQFVSSTGYQTDAEKDGWAEVYINGNRKILYGANWKHPLGLSSNLDSKQTHPVVLVSWQDASAYCSWAGRKLPSEAQWEKAARGMDGRIYPWGNDTPTCKLANFNQKDYPCVGSTSIVGSYPEGASPYGVFDMAGNVNEWVEDWYGLYSPDDQVNPGGPTSGVHRIIRGGSWSWIDHGLMSFRRHRYYGSSYRGVDLGFRCSQPSP